MRQKQLGEYKVECEQQILRMFKNQKGDVFCWLWNAFLAKVLLIGDWETHVNALVDLVVENDGRLEECFHGEDLSAGVDLERRGAGYRVRIEVVPGDAECEGHEGPAEESPKKRATSHPRGMS